MILTSEFLLAVYWTINSLVTRQKAFRTELLNVPNNPTILSTIRTLEIQNISVELKNKYMPIFMTFEIIYFVPTKIVTPIKLRDWQILREISENCQELKKKKSLNKVHVMTVVEAVSNS